jgi:uncharacterized membrane protein YhaH (DUF805 family)
LNVLSSVRHNLINLFNFGGRDSPNAFWPYGLIVGVVWLCAPVILAQVLFSSSISNFNIAVQPGQLVAAIIPWYLGWIVLAAGLLGAAVARRLRDANQSPVWGVWPLLLAALNALFLFEAFSADDIPNAWFLPAMGGNLLLWVLLIVLVVKLADGTAHSSPDKRHAPKPTVNDARGG